MVLQALQENLQASADPAGYLLASPPGTVLPIPGSEEFFWVRGSECVYEIDAGSFLRKRMPACECKGFRRWNHCKHLRAVSDYLREWRLCPICRGVAYWRPNGSVIYADPIRGGRDRTAIPLVCCLGAGTREAWEREGRFVPREVAA